MPMRCPDADAPHGHTAQTWDLTDPEAWRTVSASGAIVQRDDLPMLRLIDSAGQDSQRLPRLASAHVVIVPSNMVQGPGTCGAHAIKQGLHEAAVKKVAAPLSRLSGQSAPAVFLSRDIFPSMARWLMYQRLTTYRERLLLGPAGIS